MKRLSKLKGRRETWRDYDVVIIIPPRIIHPVRYLSYLDILIYLLLHQNLSNDFQNMLSPLSIVIIGLFSLCVLHLFRKLKIMFLTVKAL